MIRRLSAALLVFLFVTPAVTAENDEAEDLVGVWALKSFNLQVIGETAPKPVFGASPKGHTIFTSGGLVVTILARADRKPAATVEQQAALLQSMVAYSGRYRVNGDQITISPEVSWNEIYSGTQQIRFFSISADRRELRIRTAKQESGVMPGKTVIATLTYEREE